MALKFETAAGWGLVEDAIHAIEYAADNGADIISCSWHWNNCTAHKEACEYAYSQGVFLVAAAGNFNNSVPHYPAYYDCVMAVASTDSDDKKAASSNYGDWVDVAAPGHQILSLRACGKGAPNNLYPYQDPNNNATMYILSGTSMACPYVAGLAGLCLAADSNLTPGDLRLLITRYAHPLADPNLDCGRINADKSLSYIGNLPDPNKATAPAPANDANLISIHVHLDWTVDELAGSHDVYLGTDFNDVNDANSSSSAYKGDIFLPPFDPNTLDANTTYYWRIDTKNSGGSAKGDVWNFSTRTGDTIYVDGDANGNNDGSSWSNAYTSLASGLDMAFDGDQVWAAEGTYKPTDGNDRSVSFEPREGVKLYGGFDATESALTDRDANLGANQTVLSGDINEPNDASDNCYHVIVANDNVVLDRLKVANGNANGPDASEYNRGGGIFSVRTSALGITDCTFTANNASSGSSIYNHMGSVCVSGCTFVANSTSNGAAITDGLYCTLVLTNSLFIGNSGGAVSLSRDTPVIANCTFVKNEASYGGGLYTAVPTPFEITNCIFWDNTATAAGDQIHNTLSDPNISYCDIEDCYDGNDVWDSNLGTDGGGNIDQDPCFVDDDANDFHIGPNSPCIDAGDPNGSYSGQTDIDGEPRVQGTYVDMGADEARRVHNVDKDKWYVTIQAAIDDSNDGNDIVVYAGTYEETVDYKGKAITVRSTDPNDANVVAATIIDGNGALRAVYFHNSEDGNSVLMGLTVTGGFFGVECGLRDVPSNYVSPTISNCVVQDSNTYGVYCHISDPTITNCTIKETGINGVRCFQSAATIQNSVIEHNALAGIYAWGSIAPIIRHNEIRENSSDGIKLVCSSAIVKSNWIYGNGRHGIPTSISGSAVLMNNTIVDNSGIGISADSLGTQPSISNCIIWDCTDDLYNCTATYSCISDCNDANGVGNICGDANDPNFVDPNNDDYHLASGSPCIDAGDPNGTYTGELDIDLEDRVMGDYVDMGGDERDPNS
jgi:hypothetical protein